MSAPLFRIEPMRVTDLHRVMEIEVQAHPAPWPASAYRHELEHNEMAHYLVVVAESAGEQRNGGGLRERLRNLLRPARAAADDLVVGYAGFWLMVGEAHISTVAVDPDWRRQGLGELLLLALIERAIEIGAELVTLEVRVSNQAAQRLYEKYGFEYTGLRRRYYRDNNEDAHIMTVEGVDQPAYREMLDARWAALRARLAIAPGSAARIEVLST